ncbi:MAG TPA: TorF family putative porin [Cellvibrio sp.]|nr:TorF family putative porin [Cellvibrio sp.]
MKMKQKLIAGAIALSAMAGFSVPAAQAEVSAAVGAANMYYWRGFDLGLGDPQVWGDLKASAAGFYGGVWAASGDAVLGQEIDLYAGYGHAFGDFKVDLSFWSYVYPSSEIKFGESSEGVLALSYGPVTASYYKNIASEYGDNSYSYASLAVVLDKFTLKYGVHAQDDQSDASLDGVQHVDLTYTYNEKLAFTLGQVIDEGVAEVNNEAKFVVALTLPIE